MLVESDDEAIIQSSVQASFRVKNPNVMRWPEFFSCLSAYAHFYRIENCHWHCLLCPVQCGACDYIKIPCSRQEVS